VLKTIATSKHAREIEVVPIAVMVVMFVINGMTEKAKLPAE
jgi:hypothetical protein